MKALTKNPVSNKRIFLLGCVTTILLGMQLAGCDDYSGGGDGPQLLSASATCTDDSWRFEASIEDPDGDADVALVYVDVYDSAYSENTAVGSMDLALESSGTWGVGAGAGENGLRGCDGKDDFEFDFWVEDLSGNRDSGRTVAD